jgi:hypothetical protein
VLAASAPIVGTTTQFSMAAAAPNAPVVFAWNFGPPPQILVGSCPVHIDLPIASLTLAGTTSSAGAWTHGFALPPLSGLVGLELTTQALVLVGGGPLLGLGDLSTGVHLFLGL